MVINFLSTYYPKPLKRQLDRFLWTILFSIMMLKQTLWYFLQDKTIRFGSEPWSAGSENIQHPWRHSGLKHSFINT